MKISRYLWRNSLNLIKTMAFSAKKRKNWVNPKATKQNEQKFNTQILLIN